MSLLILGIDDEADVEASRSRSKNDGPSGFVRSFGHAKEPDDRQPRLRDVAITPEQLEKEMKVIGVPDWCNLPMKRLR